MQYFFEEGLLLQNVIWYESNRDEIVKPIGVRRRAVKIEEH